MSTTNPLFKFGVDIEGVDGENKTALHRAAMFSDQDKVAWLLDEGLELEARDAAGSTPLHCAVFYMQRAVIKLFLSHGADISTRDNQGFTPLHTAASHSSFQAHLVLADLLEGGADMEAQDNEGRTPLLLALEGNRKEAIDVLIATGAETDVADKQGRTALHLAVGCSSKMVEKLLALRVTIDAKDCEGRTALHYAAHKGVKATALVLLKAGADLEATDKLGRQALDIAEAGAHSKLADFLKQWAPAQPQVPSSQEAVSPAQPASCPEADSHADGMQTPTGASPPGLGNGSHIAGQAVDDSSLFLERSISRAQKIQEVQSVIAERNSLQQQLAQVTAQKEAEIRQLHEDRAALQASLRTSEESHGSMRSRLLDLEKRASEAAQLRVENAELAGQVTAMSAELAAHEAAAPQIEALHRDIDSLKRRNADLKEELRKEQEARRAEAVVHAGSLEVQVARIKILQEANEALVSAAAAARSRPTAGSSPPPLGRAIQGAMSALQGLPVLKDHNRSAVNAKPGAHKQSTAGQQSGASNENTTPERAPRIRASIDMGRPTVRRVGGGYLHSPSPANRTSPPSPASAPAVGAAAADAAAQGSPTAHAEAEQPPTAPRSNQASGSPNLQEHLSVAMKTLSMPSSEEPLQQRSPDLQDAAPSRPARHSVDVPRLSATRDAPQHVFQPPVMKLGSTSARQELVLGSPSTRASTPQSRSQLWLKDQVDRSKAASGSAAKADAPLSGLKQRLASASVSHKESRPWGSLREKVGSSSASKAHKSLIDRFNSPGGDGR